MRVTTRSVRGRNAMMIRLFALQSAHGFTDEFIGDVYGVSASTVEGWRNGVLPRNDEGNLRAGVELIEEVRGKRRSAMSTSWSMGPTNLRVL